MSSHVLRIFIFCFALLCGGMNSQAGVASFTERGTIDFDRAMQLLNPYGTWSKIDGVWAYTPLDREAPYTNGRWLYTEYGWYWKGNHPHSWLTEHYGYWKRGADKVWSWYTGPSWLSEIVEFRQTSTHIGWRSGAVDNNGDFIESPDDRYAKTDEWTFVTKEQFANPITPAIVAKPDMAQKLLEDSTDCNHAYLTYRPIDRPGPHPADFLSLCKDGGMFSPLQTEVMAQPVSAITPAVTSTPITPEASPNAKGAANIAHMTGTNAPTLNGMGDDGGDQIDKRQVKYWVTMSLPTYWTPRPPDAKLEEVYMFRPDFFQDQDGIARRITLWFNPQSKTSLKEVFAESMAKPKTDAVENGSPATPATPAVSASAHDPFRSPLDTPVKPSHASSASSKVSSPNGPAPSGLVNDPGAPAAK